MLDSALWVVVNNDIIDENIVHKKRSQKSKGPSAI